LLALASLDRACRDHCPDVSATFTTIAFDDSSLGRQTTAQLLSMPRDMDHLAAPRAA
jgi:hypothetical protein